MKCYSCGYENKEGVTFCRKCGVNLKTFDDNVEVLNKDFKVERKTQSRPVLFDDSIQAKLMYKHDRHTGQLRIAKTKCATLIVFCGFTIFGLIVYSFMFGVGGAIFVSVIMGLLVAIPVAIVGHVIGWIIDKIIH